MSNKNTSEKLLTAYTHMLERVKGFLDNLDEQATPAIHKAIETARKTAVELGELTHEEAEKISLYLKRDLQDAGQFLKESGQELADWLVFDWQLIEERIWEAFLSVADQTQLAWLEFEQQLELGPRYTTGEITAMGTLYCVACSQPLHFYQIAHIPPCPKCHGTEFIRSHNAC